MQNEKIDQFVLSFNKLVLRLSLKYNWDLTSAANFNDYRYVTILHKKPLKFIYTLNCAGLQILKWTGRN